MNTLTLNVEIKEENKDNGKLKDEFKLNVQVNFIKNILDLIKSGEDITIEKIGFMEGLVETSEDVEVIDPDTKEKKILKDKVKKNCYNAIGLIKMHKYVKLESNKPSTELRPQMVANKKITEVEGR